MKKKEKKKEGVARLFELAGPKKNKLMLACVLSLFAATSRIMFFASVYGVISEVVMNLTSPRAISFDGIIKYTILVIAGIIIYGGCGYLSSAISHTAAYDVLYELRIKLMEKMSHISLGYFDGSSKGKIKKIMSDDVEQIEVFIAHNLSDVVSGVGAPVVTIIFLFFIDFRLTLVALLPIIISLSLLGIVLGRKDKAALQKEMATNHEKMTSTIVEFINGMQVIKVFNRSLGAFKRYQRDVDDFVGSVDKTAKANAAPMGFYYVFFGGQLLFLLPTSILILNHGTDYIHVVLKIILFLIIGQGLKEPLENMMNLAVGMNRINESIRRIDEVLAQEEIHSEGNEVPDRYDVEYKDVSFSYDGENEVLKNINIKVPQGFVCGIVGPSGSGKTTFLEMLLRFYPMTKGNIYIGGVDISNIPYETLMDKIAFVFQENAIFSDTVENNIRMGNTSASFEKVQAAAKSANIHDKIMSLPDGYQTIIGTANSYLSGGEKQRLAIARLFLKDAPIIVMDEAMAYADSENESKIQSAIAKLSKNKTVFIIAHRIKSVENADKILVFQDGEIIACDTHENLWKDCELYHDMVCANERRDSWTIKNYMREEAAV